MKNPRLRGAAAAAALVLGVFTTTNVHAVLTEVVTDGVAMVYSSVTGVHWLKDADLFQTWIHRDGLQATIDKILAASPTVEDPALGTITLTGVDFGDYWLGTMTWWGANGVANYLNSIAYGGRTDWRLPTSYDRRDEFFQLAVTELGGVDGQGMPETPYFDNEKLDRYWAYRTWARDGRYVDTFWAFVNSPDHVCPKNLYDYAWFVAGALPATVAAVPEPGAGWLLMAGLGVVGATAGRRSAKAGR